MNGSWTHFRQILYDNTSRIRVVALASWSYIAFSVILASIEAEAPSRFFWYTAAVAVIQVPIAFAERINPLVRPDRPRHDPLWFLVTIAIVTLTLFFWIAWQCDWPGQSHWLPAEPIVGALVVMWLKRRRTSH